METVLIFAGGDADATPLADELPVAELVIAADSGYDLAVSQGFPVDVLVGDLDSIRTPLEEIPRHVLVDRHPVDKDSTDLELALERVMDDLPSRVVVVGGAWGRIDHELAIAALLCSSRWQEIEEIDWVTGRGRAHVVRGRRILHGDVGDMVTLIPMGGPVRGLTTRGLKWDLDGDSLYPGTSRGVSNELTGPVADIRVEEGCLLAVMPST